MKKALRVAACIPALNEDKSIGRVIIDASKHVRAVLVVDDGSDDYTGAIAEKLGAHVVRHERNRGKGICLADGFGWARSRKYDVLVTLDGDGQHDPKDIPKLLQPIVEGKADIVIGSRIRRPQTMPRLRRVAQRSLDRLTGVKTGGAVVDSQSGFRAYSRRAINALEITEPGMGAETELLMKAERLGLDIVEVPVSMRYDIDGTSKLNPFIQFTDAVSAIVKEIIGRRPLRFLGIPGVILIGYGVYNWLSILASYNLTREFAIGHALVYTAVLLSGIFITITAIVLFVIRLMLQELRGT